MDLILLQPGNKTIFGGDDTNSWAADAAPGGPAYGLDDPIAKQFGHCIELVSVHQGVKQQVTTDVSNSARTSGRPIITDFTCVKYVDKTSVKFYELCLRAEPLGKGKDQPTKIHILRNFGDKTANILSFHLRDALISEIQFQSHSDDMPTEQFKLNFTEILWESTVQSADAARAGIESSGWSLARNRVIGSFTD
ncbi:Hcp family type VI secretion system effector [Lysobacter tyrosinilyticus]